MSHSREQSFSETLEVDENDSPFPKSTVLHIIALKPDGTLLGSKGFPLGSKRTDDLAVRMLKGDDHAKLGRLAVSQDARGLHLGKRLVTQGESTVAGAWGTKRIELSAQHQVEGFYEKCGYKSTGKEEMDEGWRHVCMEKEL